MPLNHSPSPTPVDPGAHLEADRDLIDAVRLRTLRHLFAAAAHDLKTPLNAIALHIELLKDALTAAAIDALPDAHRHHRNLTLIASEIQRLKVMLGSLVDEVRGRPDEPADFDLLTLIHELAALLKPLAVRHRFSLHLHAEGPPAIMHGRRDLLRQALLSLAINAVEAMTAGGSLALTLDRHGHEAEVTITDTGRGMSPEVLAALAQPQPIPRHSAPGTGLYVARRVVEAHGGNLRAHAAPGHGAAVHLRLPLTQPM